MTESPHVHPASFTDLEGAIGVVRASGSRLSSARKQLLQALFEADGPVSAEDLARSAGGEPEAADLASIYRNLELFERLGIVRHVHLGHGPGRYALAGERDYLVCESCGRVQTAAPHELDAVRAEIRERFAFEVRFSHFPIAGLCAECAGGEDGSGHDHRR